MTSLLQTRRVCVFILALGLFTMAARGITDPDVWWHLRTGQLILQNHSVFHTDPYSFTRFGRPWINHEWLSEVLLFGIYRLAGFGGLIVAFAAVIAAALFLVFPRSPGRPYLAALMTLWGAVASASTWGVRPQMFSLLLASIFLVLLDASERRPQLLWWTAPLMLLWVNLHAGYPIGLAFIAFFLLGEGLGGGDWSGTVAEILASAQAAGRRVRTLRGAGGRESQWHQTLLVPVSDAGIRGDAPLHPRVVFSGLPRSHLPAASADAAGSHGWTGRGSAMSPAAQSSAGDWPRSRRRCAPCAISLFWCWSSSRCSPRWPRPGCRSGEPCDGPARRALGLGPRTLVFNLLVLLAFAGFTVVRVRQVVGRQGEAEARHFPAAAAAFLQQEHPPGPMMNHYNWGGYFIWKLYPQYRVFLDGRADVYGDTLMNEFGSCYHLKDDWRKPIEAWGIRTVVLPPDAPLITALRSSPKWRQIYGDTEAVILTRGQ